MGFLARFFSSYSESFTAAVLAWPFASFALTLPILALLYHRDGRIRLLSAAGAYLSVVSSMAKLVACGAPVRALSARSCVLYAVPAA